jgi:hypothetical protein
MLRRPSIRNSASCIMHHPRNPSMFLYIILVKTIEISALQDYRHLQVKIYQGSEKVSRTSPLSSNRLLFLCYD